MPERKPKWPPYNKNLCRYAQKKLKINQNIDRRENTVLWMDRKYEAVLSLVDISLNKNTYIVLQILDFYEGHSTYECISKQTLKKYHSKMINEITRF